MMINALKSLLSLTAFLIVWEISLAQVQIEFTIIDCQQLNTAEMNDNLQFVHKNSSQSLFELSDGTYLEIQEIIRINDDSLTVELLRYSPFQWQTAPSTSAMGNYFDEPPGFASQPKQRKKLALKDIHFIYYSIENSYLNVVLLFALLFGVIVGFLMSAFVIFSNKALIKSLQNKNRILTEELNDLRNVAIDEGIYESDDGEY